jgi:hypothetical protein
MNNEYKAPDTRIKVVKSAVQTDYWPQRKNWLGFWETYSKDCLWVWFAIDKEVFGSLKFAKKVIDLHHASAKQTWEDDQKIKKHKEKQKTTYIKYP